MSVSQELKNEILSAYNNDVTKGVHQLCKYFTDNAHKNEFYGKNATTLKQYIVQVESLLGALADLSVKSTLNSEIHALLSQLPNNKREIEKALAMSIEDQIKELDKSQQEEEFEFPE